LRGIREIRGLDIRKVTRGIIYRSTDSVRRERLDTALGHLAERRHAYAQNEYIVLHPIASQP
jgi:hypothetical protein